MRRVIVFHPFLAGPLPVIISLTQTNGLCKWVHAIPPSIVTELFAILVFAVLWLTIKDVRKAGVATTIISVLFFCFTLFVLVCNCVSILVVNQDAPEMVPVVFYVILVATSCWIATRDKLRLFSKSVEIDHDTLTNSLNLLFSLLMVFNLTSIGMMMAAGHGQFEKVRDQMFSVVDRIELDKALSTKPKPDIYYLIFDSFPASKTLFAMHGYDNSALINWLTSHGFYIATHARSNYDRTTLSTSSALNMQYMDKLLAGAKQGTWSQPVFEEMVNDNCCKRLVERLGYKYIKADGEGNSGFASPFNFIGLFAHPFTIQCINLTPLRNFRMLSKHLWAEEHLAPDRTLSVILEMSSPKFVHINVNAPHVPWVFDANGNIVDVSQKVPSSYLNQLKFSEKLIRSAIELILAKSKQPPIIIVQGDHGPWDPNPDDLERYFKMRMRILNAYYLPGVKNRLLYEGITPVNSFRVVFNDYFNIKLPLLPDESFCGNADLRYINDIRNVTEIVRY